MESNLTVTIFSEEYRALLADQVKFDLMLDLLIDEMYISGYDNSLSLSGGSALKIIKQFAPIATKLKYEELKKEKEEKDDA